MANTSTFPWGTVALAALGLGAVYALSRSEALVPATGGHVRKERFTYRGVSLTLQQERSGWLGCFDDIGGEMGECWPGSTPNAALNRTRQRIDARLDVETPPRRKRLAKAKGRPRTRGRRR